MPNTFTLISTTTVGAGGATTIEFASIPQTYTDLVIKLSARGTLVDNSAYAVVYFNSSSANFTSRYLLGSGSTTGSGSRADSIIYFSGASTTANTFGNLELYIPNYTGSTNKSFSVDAVSENNATYGRQELWAGLWSQTAAITNFKIVAGESTNFAQYSTASLYGILKGSGGATVA